MDQPEQPTIEELEHLKNIDGNLSIWFDNIHKLFNQQPIFILLRVQMDAEGKQRFLGIEGISPTGDSLEFMTGLKMKNMKVDNPLTG